MWPPRALLARSVVVVSATVAGLAFLAACGSPTPHDPGVPARRTAAPPPEPTLGRWEHTDAVGGFRSVARVRSQHLGNGSTEAEVLANEVASAYPAVGPARRLPAGSVLLERLHAAGAPTSSLWFAMVRQPATGVAAERWQFLVLRPDGALLARDPPGCARCHADAPFDGVFGPPRERAPAR